MFNRFLYIVLFCLAGFLIHKSREMDAVECNSSGRDFPISIQLDMPDPQLNTDLSIGQLTHKMNGYHKGRTLSAYQRSLGLTEANWDIQFKIATLGKQVSFSGQRCLSLEKVDVYLNLAQTIYLAESTTKDRCQLKTLFDHEMRHAKINRDLSKKYIKKLKESIYAGAIAFKKDHGWGPYTVDQFEGSKNLISDYLNTSIQNEKTMMEREMGALQGQVDTPQEYKRIGDACDW